MDNNKRVSHLSTHPTAANPHNTKQSKGASTVIIEQSPSSTLELREGISKAKDLLDKIPSGEKEHIKSILDKNTHERDLISIAENIQDQNTQEKAWKLIALNDRVCPKIRINAVLRIKNNNTAISDLKDEILAKLIQSEDPIGKLSACPGICEIEKIIHSQDIPEAHQDNVRRIRLIGELDNADKKNEVLLIMLSPDCPWNNTGIYSANSLIFLVNCAIELRNTDQKNNILKIIIGNTKGQDFGLWVQRAIDSITDPTVKNDLLLNKVLDSSLSLSSANWCLIRIRDEDKKKIALDAITEKAKTIAKDSTLDISARIGALEYINAIDQRQLVIFDLSNELMQNENFDESLWNELFIWLRKDEENSIPRLVVDQLGFSKEFRRFVAEKYFEGEELALILEAIDQNMKPSRAHKIKSAAKLTKDPSSL